jgi:hypothetical protein
MKKWELLHEIKDNRFKIKDEDIIKALLKNRGFISKKDIGFFLSPPDPYDLSTKDVEIDQKELVHAIKRIKKAIEKKESTVVYTDYDADGITSPARPT